MTGCASTAAGSLRARTGTGTNYMRAQTWRPLKRQLGQGMSLSVLERTAGVPQRLHAGVYCDVPAWCMSGIWSLSGAEQVGLV